MGDDRHATDAGDTGMGDTESGDGDEPVSSAGAHYGFAGAAAILLGVVSLDYAATNVSFAFLGYLLVAAGSYAMLAGGVARGIQLARQAERQDRQQSARRAAKRARAAADVPTPRPESDAGG